VFDLFIKRLLLLEGFVILQAFNAYVTGTWSLHQMMEQWPGRKLLPFNRHGGMLGDLLIVSIIAAWISVYHSNEWSMKVFKRYGLISFVLGTAVSIFWVMGSKKVIDSFGVNGLPRMNAFFHWIYFVYCFAMILLYFYASTPRSLLEAGLITSGLSIHLMLGMLQTASYSQGIIPGDVWKPFWVLQGILVLSFANLVRKL
jgi:hypothetical protein